MMVVVMFLGMLVLRRRSVLTVEQELDMRRVVLNVTQNVVGVSVKLENQSIL
jgi:hypothetical protein